MSEVYSIEADELNDFCEGQIIDMSAKLQDIKSYIRIVEDEKNKGWWYKFGNRLACPQCFFKSTEEWLEILYFEKKQEEEKIRFLRDVKVKYAKGQI